MNTPQNYFPVEIIPVRLQRSRAKGSRLVSPNGLEIACCTRGTRWGNPYRVTDPVSGFTLSHEEVIASFTTFSAKNEFRASIFRLLNHKNLACWCKLCPRHLAAGKPLNEHCPDCTPCHVDVLGAILYGKVKL